MSIREDIMDDVAMVTKRSLDQPVHKIYAVIHTDQDDIPVPRVKRFSVVMDYVKSITERGNLDIQVYDGPYIDQIYSNRQKLEVTVVIEHPPVDGVVEVNETRYRATIPQTVNGAPSMTDGASYDAKARAKGPGTVIDLAVVLYRREYEPMMAQTASGNLTGGSRDTAVSGVLSDQFTKIIIDGHPAIDNVDITPTHNEEAITQAILPSFTRTIDIPTIIQEEYGGIYRGGMGSFFQEYDGRKTFFVYPFLLNEEQTARPTERLKLLVSPSLVNRAQPSTWVKDPGLLTIVGTAEKVYKDNRAGAKQSQGMGFSSISGEHMMSDSADVVGGALKAHSARLNTIVGDAAAPDDLNYAPKILKRPNVNSFAQASRLQEAAGGTINAVWENSAPRHIRPAMYAEILTGESAAASKLFGTVVWHHTAYLPVSNAFTTDGFYSNTELAIYTKTMDDNYRT